MSKMIEQNTLQTNSRIIWKSLKKDVLRIHFHNFINVYKNLLKSYRLKSFTDADCTNLALMELMSGVICYDQSGYLK